MTNFIVALLIMAVGIIVSMYGSSLNSNLLNVDYIFVAPFFYYLVIGVFPRLQNKNLMTSLGGILMCIVIYAFMNYRGYMEIITPILITAVVSTLITYVLLRLIYKRE